MTTVIRYSFVTNPIRCTIVFQDNTSVQFNYSDSQFGVSDCTRQILFYSGLSSSSSELTSDQLNQVDDLNSIYSDFIWSGLLSVVTAIFALSLLLRIINAIFRT